MNNQQITWLQGLDKEGMDGTIQSFLFHPALSTVGFEPLAKKLIEQLVKEKKALVEDNIELSRKVGGLNV